MASLTEERDQLKMDLQENVEMVSNLRASVPHSHLNMHLFQSAVSQQMIEHQEELRTALEKNREQKELIRQLETAQTSRQDAPPTEMTEQQEELQTHVSLKTFHLCSGTEIFHLCSINLTHVHKLQVIFLSEPTY